MRVAPLGQCPYAPSPWPDLSGLRISSSTKAKESLMGSVRGLGGFTGPRMKCQILGDTSQILVHFFFSLFSRHLECFVENELKAAQMA